MIYRELILEMLEKIDSENILIKIYLFIRAWLEC